MKQIMILGGGTMAIDLAYLFAKTDHQVSLWVQDQGRIAKATTRLEGHLDRLVSKEKITTEDKTKVLAKVTVTDSLQAGETADLVLEAVVEDMAVKKDLFQKLDNIVGEHCIFATNTSSLSITDLATATNRPEKCIGVHFFNPASVMKLVELIRGLATDDATLEAMKSLCLVLEKEAVEVEETPGFVVNRLLVPMINDACNLLESGVATREGIDTCMMLGANHPMGPLALGDFVGLDVCLAVMETLFQETGDPRYRPSLLLRKMVAGKRLGKKTKIGFYDYRKK